MKNEPDVIARVKAKVTKFAQDLTKGHLVVKKLLQDFFFVRHE